MPAPSRNTTTPSFPDGLQKREAPCHSTRPGLRSHPSLEQGVQLVGGVPLHRRQDVAVRVQRHGDLCVPQALLHHLRVDPLSEQQRRRRVPQVVEPDGGDPTAGVVVEWQGYQR